MTRGHTGGDMPIIETPEFKAALAEREAAIDRRVDDAVEAALKRFAAPPPHDGATALADRLSIQLAKLTGQGIGTNYVDPEIVVRRKQADTEMRALLRELREKGDEPQYKLVGQTVMRLGTMGFALIEPYYRDANKRRQQTEVGSYAPPNLAMRPLRDQGPEQRVWKFFCASIGRSEVGDDEDIDDFELTQAGATIRKGLRPPRDASSDALGDADGIRILRGDDPAKRKVQVFTGMPAIEMAERA